MDMPHSSISNQQSAMRYLHLDVFTDRPLEGNQLAVFPEPRGLSPDQMQRIAKEMAFSETTFVLPAEAGGDARMRIFTPGVELPMAGHPTIGTTFALAIEGTIAPGRSEYVFELGVGPTPVSLEWNGGELAFAWMTQRPPVFGPTIADRAAVADAVGASAGDLVPGLPVQVVSCGLPFLFVPLASRRAVDAVAIDVKALRRCCNAAGIDELSTFFLTTEQANEQGAAVYSRMLAPTFGITEDPATGGASGPLGCYLLRYGAVTPDVAQHMVSLQGVAMGRPSRIHISIAGAPEAITGVRVGGTSVLVGRGELLL
jgi:trans-2,3-dihydro-3-hydroxyanthranilate isomerase